MKKKSIISKHFNGKSNVISLNNIQILYRNKYLDYIKQKKLSFENLNCPCGSNNKDHLISSRDKFGLNVNNVICIDCGLIRQNPTLDDKSLSIFYDQIYRPLYLGQIESEDIKTIYESLILKGKIIYDFLNSYINVSNYRKVLEIGCSAGGILKYFQQKNHLVKGCDFDSKYVRYGQKEGLNLIIGSSSSINDTEKFDLIILSHVVEHFKDLKYELSKILNLLNDGGVIYIQVPGIFNKQYYKSYERCDFLFYTQNAHNFYFTKNTFLNTLSFIDMNLKIIHIDEKVNIILKNRFEYNHFIENEYDKTVNFLRSNNSNRKYKKIYYFSKSIVLNFIRFTLKKIFIYNLVKSYYLKNFAKK